MLTFCFCKLVYAYNAYGGVKERPRGLSLVLATSKCFASATGVWGFCWRCIASVCLCYKLRIILKESVGLAGGARATEGEGCGERTTGGDGWPPTEVLGMRKAVGRKAKWWGLASLGEEERREREGEERKRRENVARGGRGRACRARRVGRRSGTGLHVRAEDGERESTARRRKCQRPRIIPVERNQLTSRRSRHRQRWGLPKHWPSHRMRQRTPATRWRLLKGWCREPRRQSARLRRTRFRWHGTRSTTRRTSRPRTQRIRRTTRKRLSRCRW